MPSRTPKRRPADPEFGRAARSCSECDKPVLAAPGTRHASCSHRCPVCYDPVLSIDPTNNPRVHLACSKKTARK